MGSQDVGVLLLIDEYDVIFLRMIVSSLGSLWAIACQIHAPSGRSSRHCTWNYPVVP
jgi:hypothetical protein